MIIYLFLFLYLFYDFEIFFLCFLFVCLFVCFFICFFIYFYLFHYLYIFIHKALCVKMNLENKHIIKQSKSSTDDKQTENMQLYVKQKFKKSSGVL